MASNLDKFKEQARKYEQSSAWAKAVEPLKKAIELFEKDPSDESELPLYNRLGDAYVKLNDTANAIQYYERAIDKYTDASLVNPAIALCNKVMRLSPGRSQVYLKLGMLFAKKGFAAEAKTNLLEYADRMQKAGQLEEAFKALKKFAEMTPGSEDIWTVLAQQARTAAKTPEAKEAVDKLLEEFEQREKNQLQRKSRMSRSMITGEEIKEDTGPKKGELIFLDVDDVPTPGRRSGSIPRPSMDPVKRVSAEAPPPPPPPPPPPLPPPPPPRPEPEPEPEPMAPLEIQSSAFTPPDESSHSDLPLIEVEPTMMSGQAPAPSDALDIEPTSFGVDPTLGFEPMSLGIEPTSLEPEPAPVLSDLPLLDIGTSRPSDPGLVPEPVPAADAELSTDFMIELEPELEPAEEPVAEAEPAELTFDADGPAMIDFGMAAGTMEPPAAPRPSVRTAPEPEVEPVSAQAEAAAIAAEESAAAQKLEFMDLGEVVTEVPKQKDLASRLKANPEDWEAHRLMGEALLAKGEREGGLAELDASLDGFDQAGDIAQATSVVDEILRLDPNSVRHRQKRVELAYRSGDRNELVDAYVELADALLRSNDPDKSIAVYRRVLEHDPDNSRARSAIETLAPPEPPAPAEPATPAKKAPAPAAAAPAPRLSGAPKSDFVDLGAMLLDEDDAPKDTRMRIDDEEPTGDEQKDFQNMLAAFKRGIEANVADEDFQSHYDLGVAYKEMGLLDEAIAEFQKALRSTDGRLKSSEALGLCFFEKGQYAVAEAILRRGLDLPAQSDAERIGLLYWLGRTQEEEAKYTDALLSYNRVFAVDINFADVNQRVKAIGGGSLTYQAAGVTLADVQRPVVGQLDAVTAALRQIIAADFPLIQEVNGHLLQMKGKLFRPTLLLLANEASGALEPRAARLAAVIELIHLATLVHDDSVDHSSLRRGMPTVNSLFSHQVSVIMGDYLYSRAIIELVKLDDLEPLRVLSRVTNEMTVGEMRQLAQYDHLAFREADYEVTIRSKTATLLAAACETGALRAEPRHRASLRGYGDALGMAFQITDDLLDYTEAEAVTGKPSGNDLKEHKVTLPLIAVLPRLAADQRQAVARLFATSEPSDDQVAEVIAMVDSNGGLAYARERADAYARQAETSLEELPASAARDALSGAIAYAVERRR